MGRRRSGYLRRGGCCSQRSRANSLSGSVHGLLVVMLTFRYTTMSAVFSPLAASRRSVRILAQAYTLKCWHRSAAMPKVHDRYMVGISRHVSFDPPDVLDLLSHIIHRIARSARRDPPIVVHAEPTTFGTETLHEYGVKPMVYDMDVVVTNLDYSLGLSGMYDQHTERYLC